MGWNVLYTLLSLLQILIIVRVVMSWVVSPVSRHPFVQLVRNLTDPILESIRSLLPRTGMIDLSPMIALFAIYLLQSLIRGMQY